jgi:dUTPase
MLFISKLSEQETYVDYYNDNIIASFVYPYSKAIAQALVVPVPKVEIEEISYEELQNIKSERGLGALGSSGK